MRFCQRLVSTFINIYIICLKLHVWIIFIVCLCKFLTEITCTISHCSNLIYFKIYFLMFSIWWFLNNFTIILIIILKIKLIFFTTSFVNFILTKGIFKSLILRHWMDFVTKTGLCAAYHSCVLLFLLFTSSLGCRSYHRPWILNYRWIFFYTMIIFRIFIICWIVSFLLTLFTAFTLF